MSTNRQLSYTALKEIVPLLPFTVRTSLETKSSWIKTICNSIKRAPIKFVRFHLPYGRDSDDELDWRRYWRRYWSPPEYSGVLTVDTTTWHFTFDDLSEQVRVKCSLYPGRERISSQKTLAKKFFSIFMELGVEQLELEETADPFKYIQSLNCARLKWKCKGRCKNKWLTRINNHIFDELHIVRAKKFRICPKIFITAKNLIWTSRYGRNMSILLDNKAFRKLVHFRMWRCNFPGRPRFAEDTGPSDEPLRGKIEFKQSNTREEVLHVRMADPDTESVAWIVEEMRVGRWQNGSTGEIFYGYGEKNKRGVWKKLTADFPNLKRVVFSDREISVLKVTNSYVMYVECFVEKMVLFKVSKVARAMCQLDLDAFL